MNKVGQDSTQVETSAGCRGPPIIAAGKRPTSTDGKIQLDAVLAHQASVSNSDVQRSIPDRILDILVRLMYHRSMPLLYRQTPYACAFTTCLKSCLTETAFF